MKKQKAFEGSAKVISGIEAEYEWRKQNRTEYVRTQDEQAAFYRMERLVMEYAKAFYSNISISNITLDRTDYILPIICVSRGDIIAEDPENRHPAEGRLAIDPCNKKRFCIRIALPWRTKNDSLPTNLKQTIRHELIHYYLYINDLPHEDNRALFWAFCFLFDADAYMALNDEEEAKYQRFLKALEQEKETPSFILTDLAIAIIEEDEEAMQRFKFHRDAMAKPLTANS